MKATRKSIVTASVCALLLGVPLASSAEIKVQNAQYKAEKDALYVKGKLTGEGVVRVYVIDMDHNKQIGSIDTYSKGLQFKADLPMTNSGAVPCVIKVQTAPLWRGFGFASAFGFGASEFTVATVQQSPERCGS